MDASDNRHHKQTVEEIAPTIKAITKLQRNIKRKHKELTLGREVAEEQHAKHFKPLSEPLVNIFETLTQQPPPPPPADQPLEPEPRPHRRRVAGPIRRRRHRSHRAPYTPQLTPMQQRPLKKAEKQLQLSKIGEESPPTYEAFGEGSYFSPAPSTSSAARKLRLSSSDDEEMEFEEGGATAEEALLTSSQKKVQNELVKAKLAGTLVGPYLRRALIGDSSSDATYGPKVVGNQYYLGSKLLTFGDDGSKIVLTDPLNPEKPLIFDATPGLCELIFKKVPTKQTKVDKDAYVRILHVTNLHRIGHDQNGGIINSNDPKYKKVIYKLLPSNKGKNSKVSGRGLVAPFNMVANKGTKIEYVYYNDPNELVDRLRLLDQSKAVGNTGHENEINSILEELVEGGYIVGNPAY